MFVYGCRHATCSTAVWRMFSFTSFIRFHLSAIDVVSSLPLPPFWSHHSLVDNDKITNLASPAANSKSAGYMFCFCFVFLCISNYPCQRNCLKICRSDVHQIFRVGRTMAVDYQFEFSFWCLKATIFLVFAQNCFSSRQWLVA